MRYKHIPSQALERELPIAKDLYDRMKVGQERTFEFDSSALGFCADDDNEYKLYFTGEADIPPEYRCEPQYPILYRRICESLVQKDGKYLLRVQTDDPKLDKAAYYKVFDISADAKYLNFECDVWTEPCESADCRFEIDVYYKNGRARFAYDRDAEIKRRIDINGSGRCCVSVPLSGEADFVLIGLRIERFTGTLTVDSPTLTDNNGRQYIEPFAMQPRDLTPKNWIGINLSKIERPYFHIELNGKTVFDGESVERIYRWPSHTLPLPKNCIAAGQNTVKLRYIGGYPDALDYILRDVSVLCSPTEQGIIACEKYARNKFGVLLRLKKPCRVTCAASVPEIVPCSQTLDLPAGLHIVRFESAPFSSSARIEITAGGRKYFAELLRYISKDCRDVITGTSDSIYNRLDYAGMTDYLCWYLYNRLGNMFTFRTSYRWSGSDRAEPGIYDSVIDTLSRYGVYSAIMIDGRELPSAATNSMGYNGADDKFLGFQSHERDGAFFYWGTGKHTREEAFYYEILSRVFTRQGIEPLCSLVRRGDGYYKYYDDRRATDMKEGSEYFVSNVSAVTKDTARHSGPSVLFKYFFQAGLKWLCAELMYGNAEICIAALRGASLANGQQGYGGHMAVQWSTTPHDDIYRYRRYFNALMLAYTNGLTEINTEEGCYRLEELYADFERNSAACRHHASVQSAFYDFVSTHTRRGSLHTGIAVIHGKYDSFSLFNRTSIWGMAGSEWKDSEKSWDLLKIFFPQAVLDVVYRHNCPHEPVGFYSGTPYGLIDIVPDSADSDFLNRYPYVIMLGYNCASSDFNARMLDYVRRGGTLLATLAHFMTTVDHSVANAGMGELADDEAFRALCGGCGTVCTPHGRRAVFADGKTAQVIDRRVGKGRVILFNTTAYPNHPSVHDDYAAAIRDIAAQNAAAERERGWVETDGFVSTSVFDACDRRTVYCVNVNWWQDGDPLESVTLHNAGKKYDFTVARDCVCIASIFGDTAFVTQDLSADILSYDGKLRVQGQKGDTVTVLRNGLADAYVLPHDGVCETDLFAPEPPRSADRSNIAENDSRI